jgi:hypothetical protein
MSALRRLLAALALCLAAGAAQAAGDAAPPSPLRALSVCLQRQAAAAGYARTDGDDTVVLLVVACQADADAFSNWCRKVQDAADCAHVIFVTARGVLDGLPG